MGKILIIRGASYTPPSGSGSQTPVIPDNPDPTPDPPQSSEPYEVFYEAADVWSLQRPSDAVVTGVGLVVRNRIAADVDAVSYAGSDAVGTAFLCLKSNPIELTDGTFTCSATQFSSMVNLEQGRTDFQPGTKAVVIWIYDSNGMSSGQIQTRLAAAKEAITFITG